MNNERKPGYYRVRKFDKWGIICFDGALWFSTGFGKVSDLYWDEIIETPISPSPQGPIGYDPLCFHECPSCHGRCNCSTQPCSHCVEVTDEEITAKSIEFSKDLFDGAGMQVAFIEGAEWMRDLLKTKEEQK